MAYDNETYLRSLGAARGDINRQVQNALAEVNRQRDVAMGQAGQIPGAVEGVTGGATKMADRGLQEGQGALDRLNLSDFGAFEGTRGEVAGRMGGINQSYGRASGLLQQGFGEQATQRRGQVDLIGKQLFADNDSRRMGYIAGRESEDRSTALQRELANRQAAQQAEALAQQQQLAAEAIRHQTAEANKQRDFQARQNLLSMIHESQQANPFLGSSDSVVDLWQGGQAPTGMSLLDFAQWLGVELDPNIGPQGNRFFY